MFKSFDKDISFRKLFLYWTCFFIIGVVLMFLVVILYPSPIDSEFTDNICEPFNLIFVILAPIIETFAFMIVPYLIFKKKGLITGLIIWVLLHLITRNISVFFYILVVGYFYYRCIEIKRYKEVIFFHFIPNIIGVISCFV